AISRRWASDASGLGYRIGVAIPLMLTAFIRRANRASRGTVWRVRGLRSPRPFRSTASTKGVSLIAPNVARLGVRWRRRTVDVDEPCQRTGSGLVAGTPAGRAQRESLGFWFRTAPLTRVDAASCIGRAHTIIRSCNVPDVAVDASFTFVR